MTIGSAVRRRAGLWMLVAGLGIGLAMSAEAQTSSQKTRKNADVTGQLQRGTVSTVQVAVEPPDANRTKNELDNLLNKYPPTVRGVFRQDPTLMTQEQYLAPYPALANFLSAHPEVALNPSFYLDGLGGDDEFGKPRDRASRVVNMWDNFMRDMVTFFGFVLAASLLAWLIRTFIDYRRWNRLSRVQSDVHTKLMERFSSNEDLMAYVASPAGSKFLQSAPISLDTGAGTRSMGAPLNRIMWSIQAGLVLCAAGGGLMIASGRVGEDVSLPLEIMGILAMALGVGFAVSSAVSYALSWKLGLLDLAHQKRSVEVSEAQQ